MADNDGGFTAGCQDKRRLVERILIAGRPGFIGSQVGDALVERGYRVCVLDSLVEQAQAAVERPVQLNRDVELIVGDFRERGLVREALEGTDAVVDSAARVGVGQSMYDIDHYVSTTTYGTALLLEAMLDRQAKKLLVASSMSIDDEGLYSLVPAVERSEADLKARRWEPRGADGEELTSLPTNETKRCGISSVYARELADWLERQTADDRVEHADAELAARGLTR
jgi:dTDP-L-rhamnose 4-epimerase